MAAKLTDLVLMYEKLGCNQSDALQRAEAREREEWERERERERDIIRLINEENDPKVRKEYAKLIGDGCYPFKSIEYSVLINIFPLIDIQHPHQKKEKAI
jgi:hypothetical protein